MNIAVIGSGNVGGALATAFAKAGHAVTLGVRDLNDARVQELLQSSPGLKAASVGEASSRSEVIVVAAVPPATRSIVDALGQVRGKVIIDAMNSIRSFADDFPTTTHAFQAWTSGADIVKCFNTTGFENMANPSYAEASADMFVAGDSQRGKEVARQLATDIGFGECYDFGGDDKWELLEKLALSWINLAIMQGHGRGMAFRVMKR